MSVLPVGADPAVRAVLWPRWRRARRLLGLSVAMPALVSVLCVVALALAGVGWWSAVLLVGAVAPFAAQVVWLWRGGVLAPGNWVKAAFLVCGTQFLAGVVPCLGVAGYGVLFGAVVGCGVVAVVTARRAHLVLLRPLVPELGASAFRVVVPVRFAIVEAAPVSARFEVGPGWLGWVVRWHRGNSRGPGQRVVVRFAELRRVDVVVLAGEVTRLRWTTLADGTVLFAQPGPALRLGTVNGEYVVPVPDAAVVAELVNRRRLG